MKLVMFLLAVALAAKAQIPQQFVSLSASVVDMTPFAVPTLQTEGGTMSDGLGTKVIRVPRPPDGNCPASGNSSALCGPPYGGLVPEYAKLTAWNADGSLLLLFQSYGGWWHLYDGGTYKWIRRLTENNDGAGFACAPSNGVMWANKSAGKIYYFTNGKSLRGAGGPGCDGQMQLRVLDLGVAPYPLPYSDSLVHDFAAVGSYPNPLIGIGSTPSAVECGEECNLSDDDQWVAFLMYCTDSVACRTQAGHSLANDNYGVEVGTYNLVTGETHQLPMNFAGCQMGQCFAPFTCDQQVQPLCVYDLNSIGTTDSVTMSPSGKFVMLCTEVGSSFDARLSARPGAGIESWTNQMQFVGMASGQGGSHHEAGVDSQGNDVIIGEWNFMTQTDTRTVKYARMDNPALQAGVVMPHSWTGGYHVSARAHKGPAAGWVLFSQWSNNSAFAVGWGTAENDAVYLNQPEATPISVLNPGVFRRVGLQYSIRASDYFAEPHSTTDQKFTKVVFGSNWGVAGGPDYAFVNELETSAALPTNCVLTIPAVGTVTFPCTFTAVTQ